MQSFNYPLHFIDFETCMVTIPFTKVKDHTSRLLFSSLITLCTRVAVEHKTEFIEIERGKFPNFDFVRALKKHSKMITEQFLDMQHMKNSIEPNSKAN